MVVIGSGRSKIGSTVVMLAVAALALAGAVTVVARTSTAVAAAGSSAGVSVNQWTGGFVATVKVTAGSSPVTGWKVGLTLPSGASITNAWNVNRSGNSGAVEFTDVGFNGSIAAGQTTEFGFQGTGTGTGMTPTCSTG